MSAYIIFIRNKMINSEELEKYEPMAAASFTDTLKPLAAYGKLEHLEGDMPAEGIVLLEFPSIEEAHRWYDSPAYTEARKQRKLGAEYSAYLFEGI